MLGTAAAFITMELVVSRVFARGIDGDPGSVVQVASAINLLSVGAAVATAYGAGQLAGGPGWFLAGFGFTAVYLVVGAVDVLAARVVVRRLGVGDAPDRA